MINAQDIKNGTCIRMDGKLYFCIEFLHVKPGKGNTFMRTKLKDVVSGYVLERRFNIGEKLEDVRVERRPYQYLYKEGEDYIFMNQETFDQHPIAHDLINGVDFLLEGAVVEVVSDASTETVLYADMPIKVQMKVTYTEPGLKGDTATNTLKPATVESGATVRVPLFISAKEVQKAEKAREAGECMGEALPELRDIMHKIKETYDVSKENVGVGSTIFAVKPGDGSAREQAASCQKVLGVMG